MDPELLLVFIDEWLDSLTDRELFSVGEVTDRLLDLRAQLT